MPDNVVRGIGTLRLYELIGAPLVAIVEADAQAARATLDYISDVGFVTSESNELEGSEGPLPGRLRMAQFRYRKLDENNQAADFVAEVPLLSLVPIPALQVRDAKVKLAAKVVNLLRTERDSREAPLALRKNLSRLDLVAKPVPVSSDKDISGTVDISVEITLNQADIPLGLEKLFNLMDTAIRDEKA